MQIDTSPYHPEELLAFIVTAKSKTYIGSGEKVNSHRPNSFDMEHKDGVFSYLDSYYGSSNFIGEEIVYFMGRAIWGMNYYGKLLRDDMISAAGVGEVLKQSLSNLYTEGRFLGPYEFTTEDGFTYIDTNEGDFRYFTGKEYILKDGEKIYELTYHGGLLDVEED
jgi:hypothetical protein